MVPHLFRKSLSHMTWPCALFHTVKQWFVKPTCSYCTLACEPQYGERCEICDEAPAS